MLKHGDIVKIIDHAGGSYGKKGDLCKVEDINASNGVTLVYARILSGEDKGKLSDRFVYRYELVKMDWDE